MNKAMIAGGLAALMLAGSVTTASARWHGGYYHRGPGPVLGLLGGVVVGAATIATLPLALVAGAARPASGPGPGYYGPPEGAYAAPPPPPPGYYYGRRAQGYYGPPPGYYGGYGGGY